MPRRLVKASLEPVFATRLVSVYHEPEQRKFKLTVIGSPLTFTLGYLDAYDLGRALLRGSGYEFVEVPDDGEA